MLTAQNNAKPMCTFTSFRKLSNFIKVNQQDSNLDGAYNANPFIGIYSTLLLQTIDGSITAFTYALEVTHVFYVTLNDRDMILST